LAAGLTVLLIAALSYEYPHGVNAVIKAGAASSAYVVAVVAALTALALLMKKAEFKTHHDLASLMKFQSGYWRTLAPTTKFNPDIDDANLAPARSVSEFLSFNKIETVGKTLDRDACSKIFAKQLLSPWNGVLSAPVHARCIAFIAAVHAVDDSGTRNHGVGRGEGLKLRQDIAVACAAFNDISKRTTTLEDILKPYASNDKLVRLIDGVAVDHHYVSTALMRLVQWARRENGILASAEFLWLKGADRDLWYALNNLGRRSFHPEGAGAVAHYQAETAVRSALAAPCVDLAVDGIEAWLKERDRRAAPVKADRATAPNPDILFRTGSKETLQDL
jgi:hypothetical protein